MFLDRNPSEIYIKLILWLIILTTCTRATPTSVVTRTSFGESCNSTLKCSKAAWLSCKNSTCGCMRGDEMEFNTELQKCVTKAGERCRFELNSDLGIVEQTECVSNATCGAEGVCTCNKYYYETSSGSCVAQKLFLEACDSNLACKADTFLKCVDGLCLCNKLSAYFASERQCVGLVQHLCLNSKCTTNAECSKTGICECKDKNGTEFYESKEGQCERKKDYGMTCVSDVECKRKNVFLTCVKGVCSCEPNNTTYEQVNYIIKEEYPVTVWRAPYGSDYPTQDLCSRRERYNYRNDCTQQSKMETRDVSKTRHECVGKADKYCSLNSNCVKNSICTKTLVDSFSRILGTCNCDADFSSTSSGVCGHGYGRPCDDTRTCSDAFTCSEGKCECHDPLHQIYDESNKKCRSKNTGICTTDSDCVSNAECIAQSSGPSLCQCIDKDGARFVENKEGNCDMAYGSPCEYSDTTSPPCDKLAGLKCRNKRCSCPEVSMIYEEKKRQCSLPVGSKCSQGTCVSNAVCSGKSYIFVKHALYGVCTCPEGYTESGNRTCVEVAKYFGSTTEKEVELSTEQYRSDLNETELVWNLVDNSTEQNELL